MPIPTVFGGVLGRFYDWYKERTPDATPLAAKGASIPLVTKKVAQISFIEAGSVRSASGSVACSSPTSTFAGSSYQSSEWHSAAASVPDSERQLSAGRSWDDRADEDAFTKYSIVASHFKPSKHGILLKAKDRGSKILPATLYKIVSTAQRLLNEGEQAFVTAQDNQFLLAKQRNDLKVFQLTNEELGSGGFGKVAKVADLSAPVLSSLAMKCARDFSAARHDVRHESELLLYLHEDAMADGTFQRGVQRPPQAVFDLCMDDFYTVEDDNIELDASQSGKKLVGYLAPLYDSSLFEHSFKSMKLADKIDCAHQLLCGLYFCLEEKNLRLGDVKSENCLIKQWTDEQGKIRYECVLSDFGGARFLEGEAFTDWGTETSCYCVKADEADFNVLSRQLSDPRLTAAEKEAVRAKITALLKARDVYALSFVINKIFGLNERAAATAFEEEVQGLIEKMSHADYRQRISIGEALASFEAIAHLR